MKFFYFHFVFLVFLIGNVKCQLFKSVDQLYASIGKLQLVTNKIENYIEEEYERLRSIEM